MNFKQWYESEFKRNGISYNLIDSQNAWNAAKEEILKIIFLNTKVNGEHKVNIEKIIEEIEKL